MSDSTFMERMRGKRLRDRELANESGQRDPRLPPPTAEERAKEFREANEAALKGLRSAKLGG